MTSFFQFGVTTARGVIEPGEYPTDFLFRQPVITGAKAAIAQAAYEAGFDCSDPIKLYHLIDAVLLAKNRYGYPDRWDGPAAFRSSIYPSTWTPAHAERKRRKGVLQAYREAAVANAAVPAFSLSADEIIRNAHHNISTTRGSGANRVPLAPRITNKRGWVTVETENLNIKRVKKTHPNSQVPSSLSKQRDYFDEDIQFLPNYPALLPNVSHKRYNRRKKINNSLGANLNREQIVAASTTMLFSRIAADLKNTTLKLSSNREALRLRWETERRLQLQEVTDTLVTLNERCEDLDNALRRCVSVLEQRVMNAYENAD